MRTACRSRGGGEAAEGVEVRRVVARVEAQLCAALLEQLPQAVPLSASHVRADLEKLAAPACVEAVLLRAPCDVLQGRDRGGLVVGLPVVEGERQALVLDRPRRVDLPAESGELARELAGSWMQLEPVVAE